MTRLTTESIVERIKKYQESGSLIELAKRSGCSYAYIYKLKTGKGKSLTIELGNRLDDALKEFGF